MIVVREAAREDDSALVDLFRDTPLRAGTEFVLDRAPDFHALLRMRGQFRTFVVSVDGRLAGAVSAIWHDSIDEGDSVRVGEVTDLRVARWARGGPVAARLLAAVREALSAQHTDWVICLIGERNDDARRLVLGRAGFPSLVPMGRYVSGHFPVFRLAEPPRRCGLHVRAAEAGDAGLLHDLARTYSPLRRFRPAMAFPWPDPAGQHHGWIALDGQGRPIGALVVWDGLSVRRFRVLQYRGTDRLLRATMSLAASIGLAAALPPPGEPLRLWASRWFGVAQADPRTGRALIRRAMRAAAQAGQHVLQLNQAEDDPLLRAWPPLPHSVYRTTVFGCRLGGTDGGVGTDECPTCFADLAIV